MRQGKAPAMFTCKAGGTEHQHSTATEGRACYAGQPTTWQASKREATAKVLSTPKPAEFPAGRYAIRHDNGFVRFFKVDKPIEGKWAGYTFVKRVAGSDEWPVKTRIEREAILAIIAKDPVAASKLYGTEIGECGLCGRQLTNEESLKLGIGPVCAAKVGW